MECSEKSSISDYEDLMQDVLNDRFNISELVKLGQKLQMKEMKEIPEKGLK